MHRREALHKSLLEHCQYASLFVFFYYYIELLGPVMLECCHMTTYRTDSLEQNTVIMNVYWFAAETGITSLTHWSQSIACRIKRSRLLPSLLSCISLQAWCLFRYFLWGSLSLLLLRTADRWWAMSCLRWWEVLLCCGTVGVFRAHQTGGVQFCSDVDERQE